MRTCSARSPAAILESVLLLQQHPDLKARSAATLSAMWRAAPLINAAFRRDPRHRALFMEILRQPRRSDARAATA